MFFMCLGLVNPGSCFTAPTSCRNIEELNSSLGPRKSRYLPAPSYLEITMSGCCSQADVTRYRYFSGVNGSNPSSLMGRGHRIPLNRIRWSRLDRCQYRYPLQIKVLGMYCTVHSTCKTGYNTPASTHVEAHVPPCLGSRHRLFVTAGSGRYMAHFPQT
jgi:hypothetical protein